MKIIIADDHTIVREGLKLLLSSRRDAEVVGEAGEMTQLKALASAMRPDLILLDCNMPGGEAAETIVSLRASSPETRLIVLTAEHSGVTLRALVRAGADAVLLKDSSAQTLLSAIDRVIAGESVLDPAVCARIGELDFDVTPRELQVLRLIAEGWTNPSIAERFSVSVRTIDKHRENIQRKLDVTNAVQLINKARSLGLLGEPLPL